MEDLRSELFKSLKHVVIKIGTRMLVDDHGGVHGRRLSKMVREICELRKNGYQVVLVTSGAVGMGMGSLGLKTRPQNLAKRQACAALGQIRLMHEYSKRFHKHRQHVAQILLSAEDFRNRTRYDNIKNTVQALLKSNCIPIINENDSITTDELKLGDNDKLSSDVAHFLEADLLVILSDAGGLYPKNPQRFPGVRRIKVVPKITPEIRAMAGGAGNSNSTGGMRSKLRAIEQAVRGGVPVILTDGRGVDLLSLVRGEPHGTLFLPSPKRLRGSKRWLAFISHAHGKLELDAGAVKAVTKNDSSLLPAGIRKVWGSFKPGDFVELQNEARELVGRGKTAFSSEDVKRILGAKSREVPGILGRSAPEEVIHRDYLVTFLV